MRMNYRNYKNIFKDEADVLTVTDVARLLKIGKNNAYDLIKKGDIPAIKLGRKIIVPKNSLIEFLLDKGNYMVLKRRQNSNIA